MNARSESQELGGDASRDRERWLSAGLFLVTLGTLLLELLDSRLLSVISWYHLSFMAVSLAMLGGAAGAVLVFLMGERLPAEAVRRNLPRVALVLALVAPVAHVALMRTRVPPMESGGVGEILALALVTVLLTIPFLLSGIVVTLVLTRCGGRIGRLYGFDLLGAATGCLLIVPVLDSMDILSAGLLVGAIVALGAFAFQRFASQRGGAIAAGVAAVLLLGCIAHVQAGAPIGVGYPKGRTAAQEAIAYSRWNAYSYITVAPSQFGEPFFWGKGANVPTTLVDSAIMRIDGAAGTPLMRWDGRRESIDFVQHDVTALAHHIRAGDAAVIGVGGGRDILSAIWGGSTKITGIELNEVFVDLLEDSHREFTRIADHPGVRIVNDEGRAYLSATDERYDVLQMSLVDTWAATGAGAFTLTENALYTVEAWKTFLSRLKPNGIFSTSRWFSPRDVSETSRLVSLCVATLLEMGVTEPAQHIALLARGRVATLLVSMDPLAAADVAKLRAIAKRSGFQILALPGVQVPASPLTTILASHSIEQLDEAIEDPRYDYSAPTDERPFFFNMLKPTFNHFDAAAEGPRGGRRGVVAGNVRATVTLLSLLVIALVLATAIIGVPLLVSGLPQLDGRSFALGLCYFAIIGYGFMSIQIPLLQRFSVVLGHPIYSYSVILFGMILFAGLGSFASERVDLLGRWRIVLPIAIAALVLLLRASLPWITAQMLGVPLLGRCAAVVASIAPISFLLGFCFPLGLRMIGALSERATPWMWGVNGASGVLASIVAVAVSMWAGIHTNLAIAATLYLLLALPARGLARRVAAKPA